MIIGYEEVFGEVSPENPITLLENLRITDVIHLLTMVLHLYYNPLKPIQVTQLKTQLDFIRFFVNNSVELEKRLFNIHETTGQKGLVTIISKYSILYSIEILSRKRPVDESFWLKKFSPDEGERVLKFILACNNIASGANKAVSRSSIREIAANSSFMNEVEANLNVFQYLWLSINFLQFLSNHKVLSKPFKGFVTNQYGVDENRFVHHLSFLFAAHLIRLKPNQNFKPTDDESLKIFKVLSKQIVDEHSPLTLLNIRLNPMIDLYNGEFKLIDYQLLLGKLFEQMKNDFWFQHVKVNAIMPAKNYFAEVGKFIEIYVGEFVQNCLLKTKGVVVLKGSELRFDDVEVCDVLIKAGKKIILVEVKGGFFTESQKFGNELAKLNEKTKKDLLNKFGVNQLSEKIKDKYTLLTSLFPEIKTNRHEIFRLCVSVENALSSPLMHTYCNNLIDQQVFKIERTQYHPIKVTSLFEFEKLMLNVEGEPHSKLIKVFKRFYTEGLNTSLKFAKPLGMLVTSDSSKRINEMYLHKHIMPFFKSEGVL